VSRENLKTYIYDLNAWKKPGESFLRYPPHSKDEVQTIAWELEGELSPENLTCDGELDDFEVRKKYDFYTSVRRALELYDRWSILK